MAYEAGGSADKLGNRFERRWVISQLLKLLAGRIRSLQYEPVGPDERGVDLWIVTDDGRREAQQCKGELGTKADWSMADLARLRVLGHLRSQLERDGQHTFALVSATQAVVFRDLTRSARDAEDATAYWKYQVKDRSDKHRDEFLAFCKYLDLDHRSPGDLQKAFDLLRRSHYHTFTDDVQTLKTLEMWAGCYISGAPDKVLDALGGFAETEGNLRRVIYADEVYDFLSRKGYPPRDLGRDNALPVQIEELRSSFFESMRPHLAAGRLIPRLETPKIIDWVTSPGKERLLILHGPAGVGKSGVLYELASELKARGIPFLPLRLDRQPPRGSPRRFGQERGLPDSPAICLHALAGSRAAILILDQLDALRWTSAHSSEAFPICQDIIRQAMQLDRNLLVVACCRTFDLEHDPQIKKWEKDQVFSRKIAVEPLPEPAIRGFVEQAGVRFETLSPREKRLLANVQNLAMWSEIVSSGKTPRFSTVTELSRHFWESRWHELAKREIPSAEVEALLGRITAFMDHNCRLDAPERLLGQHRRAAAELQSLNVLQVADGRVSYCHQSYLDYQITQRLLDDIDSGSTSVMTWLGDKSRQSLFRREQLRLVLTRLRDEDPERFLGTTREILFASGVRFHLKQVAVQCLGQIENPSQAEVDLTIDLLHRREWCNHVGEQILWGNASWFVATDQDGEWQRALASEDAERVNYALRVMRSVADACGDRIARLLEPYIEADDEWRNRCLYVIPFDPTKDSDSLFELRLRLTRSGVGQELVFLPEVGRRHPRRFIRLLDAHIDRRIETSAREGARSHYDPIMDSMDRVERKDRLAFRRAGRAEPELAVDLLLAAALQVVEASAEPQALYHHGFRAIPASLTECFIAAGAAMLRRDASHFFRRIEEMNERTPKEILAMVLTALLHGPSSVADRTLRWIMDRPACLRAADSYHQSEWEPARKVIHRFSRRCSDETYRAFETFLMNYHDDDERRSMLNRHNWVMEQMDYPNRHGQTQFHLLPALPDRRKSGAAKGLEDVVSRKFDPCRETLFGRHRSRGGHVTSSLGQNGGRPLSDAAWLGIIANNSEDQRTGTIRFYRDHCTESSVAQFAGDLAGATRSAPHRFARLALRIPADANPAYLRAILAGLADKNPPQHLSDEEKRDWAPLGLEHLEPVVRRAVSLGNGCHAKALCRILQQFDEMKWPAPLIESVIQLALNEPSPASVGTAGIDRAENDPPSVDDLEQRAINCLRGEVAETIQSLLWGDIDRLLIVKPAMEQLVINQDPAVRVAALGICGPVWNVDKDLAARWYSEACAHADDRVSACHAASSLMRFIERSHPSTANQIISRMIASDHPEVAAMGATHATALWIIKGGFQHEVALCRSGRPELRRGVARAAADLVGKENLAAKSIELLTPLLDDTDDEVREQCNRIFRAGDILDRADLRPFLEAYIRSRIFLGNQWLLMHALAAYTGPLIPLADVLMSVVVVCAGPLLDASRDFSTRTAHDVTEIGPLLIRLYEQAGDSSRGDIQQRCLDAWDLLLESRVGIALQLMSEIDR